VTGTHRVYHLVAEYIQTDYCPVEVDRYEILAFLLDKGTLPMCPDGMSMQELAESIVHGFIANDFSHLPPAFRNRFAN
jgi:hypothetical protein